MAPMNAKIWKNLSLSSMYLYGHTGIRNYVYNHLSEVDIDALFQNSGICGKQLNAFHDFDGCNTGNGIAVIQNITQIAYNTLKEKFQKGYNRFVEGFLSQETGVGAWLNETFGLGSTTLSSLQTIDKIVINEEAMTPLWKVNPLPLQLLIL